MDALQRIVVLFESFGPQDVPRLGTYYREDAAFKDPLHAVRGIDAIRAVYQHMFDAMDAPRFVVTHRFANGPDCVLVWEFSFVLRGYPRKGTLTMHGVSHLLLDADGRIAVHRDYWDAAEEVYEKIPVLGALMRWLKRRAGA
ncbi:nuclear transport factor 2 family protein [Ramlibacter sp.]|uniref:nuclear transport factor 2 family protein n=1 Tax=Ramlibacter sp. TaxID=1917967 RepID=UPI00180DD2E5|nr:nuclear transport factor 2 family protein [Ramlibacter sp.]MBA2674784.1 nuclear transport factor 2 family protein [Ramlibacter sp.]